MSSKFCLRSLLLMELTLLTRPFISKGTLSSRSSCARTGAMKEAI